MTNDKMADLRILGSLREENGRGTIHVEDVYPTDIDDMWSAISQPERLKRWLVDVEGDTAIDGSFTARFTSGWEGNGRVDVCEAPHRLVVTMSDGGDDETVTEATLTTEGSGTRLVIEERGLPLGEYAGHGSGWQAHIEDLALYLAGKDTTNWIDRVRELSPTYRQMARE
ncbi:MAG: hypothetical protein QOH69_2794 [Actinomycetota bacterium]|jgi:uncharacterized protein YndB with AHSA1/START domain|nr:hypothetical protein [Actinomycetota bacterium]